MHDLGLIVAYISLSLKPLTLSYMYFTDHFLADLPTNLVLQIRLLLTIVRVYLFIYLFWRRGVVVSGVRRMDEVNARRARLVPGWVTVFGRVYYLGM